MVELPCSSSRFLGCCGWLLRGGSPAGCSQLVLLPILGAEWLDMDGRLMWRKPLPKPGWCCCCGNGRRGLSGRSSCTSAAEASAP
eukprot:636067-Pelagomonas_calceolata.AAC.2